MLSPKRTQASSKMEQGAGSLRCSRGVAHLVRCKIAGDGRQDADTVIVVVDVGCPVLCDLVVSARSGFNRSPSQAASHRNHRRCTGCRPSPAAFGATAVEMRRTTHVRAPTCSASPAAGAAAARPSRERGRRKRRVGPAGVSGRWRAAPGDVVGGLGRRCTCDHDGRRRQTKVAGSPPNSLTTMLAIMDMPARQAPAATTGSACPHAPEGEVALGDRSLQRDALLKAHVLAQLLAGPAGSSAINETTAGLAHQVCMHAWWRVFSGAPEHSSPTSSGA